MLGRYRLLERLGAGGFGVVWRAQDEQLDREVALKRIPLPGSEHRERATREALASARLSHPAIVALYEACADDDAFYLISELVHGQTLAELIAADELADEQILEVGAAVAAALAHAHARGVIHRDVKPPNVIVVAEPRERGGVAKLADFGGAQLADQDALTRTGDVLGTLAYMAPEQCDGLQVGEPADVYSLALVLYEAFAGLHPVRGRTPAETARRIGRRIAPLERHRRDLPRDLTRAIDAALYPHPGRRATLGELREALELARDDRAAELLGDPPEAPPDASPDAALLAPAATPFSPNAAPFSAQAASFSPEASPVQPGVPPVSPEAPPRPAPRLWHRAGIPRAAWMAATVGLAVWQAAVGRPGVSVLALAAGAPLLALGRRSGPGVLSCALAPTLGLAGLAGAYPALAGQAARWRVRAGMGALGLWWLALAEPLLHRRLWEGPAAGTPPAGAWEGSAQSALAHVIGSLLTPQLAIQAAVWALGAAMLPWIVRGRSAALDVAAAIAWTVALLAGASLVGSAVGVQAAQAGQRGVVVGAVLGCALAVCARAVRGPA